MSKGLERYRRRQQNGPNYHLRDLTVKVTVVFVLNVIISVRWSCITWWFSRHTACHYW